MKHHIMRNHIMGNHVSQETAVWCDYDDWILTKQYPNSWLIIKYENYFSFLQLFNIVSLRIHLMTFSKLKSQC